MCALFTFQYPMDVKADSQVFSFAFFGSRSFLFLLQADQDLVLYLPHVKHILERKKDISGMSDMSIFIHANAFNEGSNLTYTYILIQ